MSEDAAPYRRLDPGTPFAVPEGMDEHNNVVARVRTLEVLMREMARNQELGLQHLDQRMRESHATWESGVQKIVAGIKETHDNLYNPQHGAFVRLDRVEQGLQAHTKFKAWLTGFLTSGVLLTLGALLGKLLGK